MSRDHGMLKNRDYGLWLPGSNHPLLSSVKKNLLHQVLGLNLQELRINRAAMAIGCDMVVLIVFLKGNICLGQIILFASS